MIKIRQATIQDLEQIQQLNNQLFNLELQQSDKHLIKDWPLSQKGKEYFIDAIENEYTIIAEENNAIIGYLIGCVSEIAYYNFKIAELCNMCVNENHKRKGVGKMLVSDFKQHFNNIGINNFIVTASYLNTNAIKFYESQGFKCQNITLCDFEKN